MKKLLLIGSGGHCKSVLDCIRGNAGYDKIGVVSSDIPMGSWFCGHEIVGSDIDLEHLYQSGYKEAFVAVGSVGDVTVRRRITDQLKCIGFRLPCIIDKTAAVSDSVVMGAGVFIGKNAIVNASSSLGECCIINSGSIVEHDCTIGDFAHVATGAVLCGNVHVRENAHIGANATVLQGRIVGAGAMIGAGTVVIKDVLTMTTVVGNPGYVVGAKID